MGNYFLVIKRIGKKKKPFYYYQRTWKEGKKTRTHSIYVGPVDKVGSNIYTKLDYGATRPTATLEKYLTGKSDKDRAAAEKVLANNARYPTGVYSRAQFIEEAAKNKEPFEGRTPEEQAYYDHLTTDTTTEPDASDKGEK